MIEKRRAGILAKIAADLEHATARRVLHGGAGRTSGRVLAQGDGWQVDDVICTCGPQDRRFEEQHPRVSISVVLAGSFQYRAAAGEALLTPGSLMLGGAGQCYECGHEHATGDRCLAFRYDPAYFETIAPASGRTSNTTFCSLRVPPMRQLSPLVARLCGAVHEPAVQPWQELSLRLAAQALRLAAHDTRGSAPVPSGAVARVTRIVRDIDDDPAATVPLADMALRAGLSLWHFLRTFESVTGVTPHQYLLRRRLRDAAVRLASEPDRVIEIAFACGFGDLSNFNRAFRAEFGASPRSWRRQATGR